MVLNFKDLSLALDLESGSLISLKIHGTERLAATSPLFKIRLRDVDGNALVVSPSDASSCTQELNGAVYGDFKSSNIAESINAAKVAVHENISNVTPEELARLACMSYSKFRKIFKEYTGFAPAQYIQEVRINIAKEILTNTSRSIKEIAFELGYENKDYFFTVFRKVTGMTPVNYRRLTRGEDA